MTLVVDIRACSNCDKEHEFFYGRPRCDGSLPHGFISAEGSLSSCRFCEESKSHPIHDMTGCSQFKPCSNCNRTHWFTAGWPGCDQFQPHGFQTYTGMEGRCQHCVGPREAFLHNEGLR